MARPRSSKGSNNSANIGFEQKLWLAADKLRSNMDAAEYKHVVLGLIFLKYISDSFEEHHAKLVQGSSIELLPQLFSKCAITTNFDRVTEEAWAAAGAPFREKIFGRGNTSAFFRAIASGDHYILKVHGNLSQPDERVLRKVEYDAAYGGDGNIHFRCALPKLLKRLYMSYSFLFVGCSLAADRTMQTFLKVAQQEGRDNLPHHYAILSAPSNPEKKRLLDERLAGAHITPIWYREDEHEYVAEILQLLIERA